MGLVIALWTRGNELLNAVIKIQRPRAAKCVICQSSLMNFANCRLVSAIERKAKAAIRITD